MANCAASAARFRPLKLATTDFLGSLSASPCQMRTSSGGLSHFRERPIRHSRHRMGRRLLCGRADPQRSASWRLHDRIEPLAESAQRPSACPQPDSAKGLRQILSQLWPYWCPSGGGRRPDPLQWRQIGGNWSFRPKRTPRAKMIGSLASRGNAPPSESYPQAPRAGVGCPNVTAR
jgi:hypothetical protein